MVLSPSPASDERLAELGIDPERIRRWVRGVDLRRFDPALREDGLLPGEINVLYAGRLSTEKGVELLADAFMLASSTETFGQVILEAQASGLPVAAVGCGGPASLIQHGETGLLAAPEISGLADAVISLASSPALSEHIRRGALTAVRGRSWEASLDRLATAYRIVLAEQDARRLVRGVA